MKKSSITVVSGLLPKHELTQRKLQVAFKLLLSEEMLEKDETMKNNF